MLLIRFIQKYLDLNMNNSHEYLKRKIDNKCKSCNFCNNINGNYCCGIFGKWNTYEKAKGICPCKECIIKTMCVIHCKNLRVIYEKIYL